MPVLLDFDTSLDDLMVDFQSPSPTHTDEFVKTIRPQIRRASSKRGADLPRDIREEVVTETFRLLLCSDRARFESSRGTAWRYLHGNILNALQLVRGSYGGRTKRNSYEYPNAGSPVPLLDIAELPNLVALPGGDEIHQSALLSEILELATPAVRYALSEIFLVGTGRSVVAKSLGLSRFTLSRQIATFAKSQAILRRCA